MKVEKKGNDLVITVPIDKKLPESKSGKTRIVFSSKGNQETDVELEGKPVIIGLNAYIRK